MIDLQKLKLMHRFQALVRVITISIPLSGQSFFPTNISTCIERITTMTSWTTWTKGVEEYRETYPTLKPGLKGYYGHILIKSFTTECLLEGYEKILIWWIILNPVGIFSTIIWNNCLIDSFRHYYISLSVLGKMVY